MEETSVSCKGASLPQSGTDDRVESVSSTVSTSANNQQSDTENLKTTEIVMGWPVVSLAVKKIQKFYESLKSASRIVNWSCEVSEKLATGLHDRSATLRAALHPAIRLVDLATSNVAGIVQKKFPVVRKSPNKVYEVINLRFNERIAPLVAETECLIKSGEKRLRRVARSSAGICRKINTNLDIWMQEFERGLEKLASKAVKDLQLPGEDSLPHPVETKSRIALKATFHYAKTVAMFCVGAAAVVIPRLPLVGRFVNISPSAASSRSTSPTLQKNLKSSSSSYESIPESAADVPVEKMLRSELDLENQPSVDVSSDQ